MSSYRSCRRCDATFRVPSHKVTRTVCYGCAPDRKNTSVQARTRVEKQEKDGLTRLNDVEKKLADLSMSFEFYNNSLDGFRDLVLDEIVSEAQRRVQEVSTNTIEDMVSKRITKFKELMYGKMVALDKSKQVQIDEIKAELDSSAIKILQHRTTITALEYELKEMHEALKKKGKGTNKPHLTEHAKYSKKVKQGKGKKKYNIGRTGLTKKQFHFIKSLSVMAEAKAKDEEVEPYTVRFSVNQMRGITNVSSVGAFVRLMADRGMMRRHKESTPAGEKGARYSWSLSPKTLKFMSTPIRDTDTT